MESILLKLMKEYPDDVHHPLVIENPDWEEINKALGEWFDLLSSGRFDDASILLMLRLVVEVIYVKGYESGKNGNV